MSQPLTDKGMLSRSLEVQAKVVVGTVSGTVGE